MEWRQRTLRKTIMWEKRTHITRFYTAPDTVIVLTLCGTARRQEQDGRAKAGLLQRARQLGRQPGPRW
jgi:hypothetical protein